MKDIRKSARTIEDALIRHRRRMERPEIPEHLPGKIMARIREEAMQLESLGTIGARLNLLVWRFTLVTCLIVALLGAYEMRSEVQLQDQLTTLAMYDDSDLDWFQDLGVL